MSGDAPKARRYVMREKMLSLGDDYWIEDDQGARVFRIDGKAIATVRSAVGWGDRFKVEVEGGAELKAHGHVIKHAQDRARRGPSGVGLQEVVPDP